MAKKKKVSRRTIYQLCVSIGVPLVVSLIVWIAGTLLQVWPAVQDNKEQWDAIRGLLNLHVTK